MKFLIERTSVWGDESPHELAKREQRTHVDVRNVNDPSQLRLQHMRDNWYKEGTNHRVYNNMIMRDRGAETVYTIEIDTLDDLVSFCRELDCEIVLGVKPYADNGEDVTLEIYDYYRE